MSTQHSSTLLPNGVFVLICTSIQLRGLADKKRIVWFGCRRVCMDLLYSIACISVCESRQRRIRGSESVCVRVCACVCPPLERGIGCPRPSLFPSPSPFFSTPDAQKHLEQPHASQHWAVFLFSSHNYGMVPPGGLCLVHLTCPTTRAVRQSLRRIVSFIP